jgi:hypothetical protein
MDTEYLTFGNVFEYTLISIKYTICLYIYMCLSNNMNIISNYTNWLGYHTRFGFYLSNIWESIMILMCVICTCIFLNFEVLALGLFVLIKFLILSIHLFEPIRINYIIVFLQTCFIVYYESFYINIPLFYGFLYAIYYVYVKFLVINFLDYLFNRFLNSITDDVLNNF